MKALLDSNAIGILYNANIEIGQYLPDWRPNRDYRICVSQIRYLVAALYLNLVMNLIMLNGC